MRECNAMGEIPMLLKRFAIFTILAGVFATYAATAAVDPRTECVREGWYTTYYYNTSEIIQADYAIYFDNNVSTIPEDCKTEVQSVINELKKKNNDIETILLFGSADATAGANRDAELGMKRANTVANLLKYAGLDFCYSEKCDNRTAKVSMGDAMNRAQGYMDSDFFARAVYMFVIYKGDVCNKSTMGSIDGLLSRVNKLLTEKPNDTTLTKVKSQLETAKQTCGEVNKVLFRSERESIMTAIKYAIDNFPELKSVVTVDVSLSARIMAIRARLSGMKRSAWKTTDGKFNTARLASDSVAGVVLGTAGGLITSHLVKKSQLKKGMEDIKCAIGGQEVASYGDDFTVGVR